MYLSTLHILPNTLVLSCPELTPGYKQYYCSAKPDIEHHIRHGVSIPQSTSSMVSKVLKGYKGTSWGPGASWPCNRYLSIFELCH